MGHAFVAYEELVHVPLIMNWPKRLTKPDRIDTPVSTRRIFHTILDAVGRLPGKPKLDPVQIHGLTLLETINGRDPEQGTAFSEIYPPLTFVRAIEKRQPELLSAFRCLSLRRAVVREANQGTPESVFKLIHVDGEADELFDLKVDPLEHENILGVRPLTSHLLNQDIYRLSKKVTLQKEKLSAGLEVNIDDNLMQRLRGLGYID